MKYYGRRPSRIRILHDRSSPGGIREIREGDEWENRREDVWRRDDGRCRCCGKPVPLHNEKRDGVVKRRAAEIHHIANRKSGGAERDDRTYNLLTLCRICHPMVEDGRYALNLIIGVVKFVWNGIERFGASTLEVNEARKGLADGEFGKQM